jgi:hypothetical protein
MRYGKGGRSCVVIGWTLGERDRLREMLKMQWRGKFLQNGR